MAAPTPPAPNPDDVTKTVPARAEKGEVFVACALPNGFQASYGGTTVTFAGRTAPNAVVGFGLTEGVDADWYDAWAESMGKDFAPVAKGIIFARKSGIVDAAKERAGDVKTGFEGLDPENPGPGLAKVEAPKT